MSSRGPTLARMSIRAIASVRSTGIAVVAITRNTARLRAPIGISVGFRSRIRLGPTVTGTTGAPASASSTARATAALPRRSRFDIARERSEQIAIVFIQMELNDTTDTGIATVGRLTSIATASTGSTIATTTIPRRIGTIVSASAIFTASSVTAAPAVAAMRAQHDLIRFTEPKCMPRHPAGRGRSLDTYRHAIHAERDIQRSRVVTALAGSAVTSTSPRRRSRCRAAPIRPVSAVVTACPISRQSHSSRIRISHHPRRLAHAPRHSRRGTHTPLWPVS